MTLSATLGVLVVDDEAEVRELLVDYFKTKRFEWPRLRMDGRRRPPMLKEPARYGLVVTDLQLPGVDGLGVLRTVKQANPSAYVVIVTGYASLDSAIQAVRLGAYDYLTKPFSLGQIDVVLQRVCDRVALENENRRLARQVQRDGIDGRMPILAASKASRTASDASRACCASRRNPRSVSRLSSGQICSFWHLPGCRQHARQNCRWMSV